MNNSIDIGGSGLVIKHGQDMQIIGFKYAVELARIAADNDQDIVALLKDKLEEMETGDE